MALLLATTAIVVTACGNSSAAEAQGKEYTSAYICPMYCEGSGSEEAGQCPACGMDYVANEQHSVDSHQH